MSQTKYQASHHVLCSLHRPLDVSAVHVGDDVFVKLLLDADSCVLQAGFSMSRCRYKTNAQKMQVMCLYCYVPLSHGADSPCLMTARTCRTAARLVRLLITSESKEETISAKNTLKETEMKVKPDSCVPLAGRRLKVIPGKRC